MKKPVAHIVRRRGKKTDDSDIEIPVVVNLVSQPGARSRDVDVSFYGRAEYRRAHNDESVDIALLNGSKYLVD